MSPELLLTKIYTEDGVKDLPSGSRAQFARALKEERKEGHTTDVALGYLEAAIAAEEEANSS